VGLLDANRLPLTDATTLQPLPPAHTRAVTYGAQASPPPPTGSASSGSSSPSILLIVAPIVGGVVALAIAGTVWYICRKRKRQAAGSTGPAKAAYYKEQPSLAFAAGKAQQHDAGVASMPPRGTGGMPQATRLDAPNLGLQAVHSTGASSLQAVLNMGVKPLQAVHSMGVKPRPTMPSPLAASLASLSHDSAHPDTRCGHRFCKPSSAPELMPCAGARKQLHLGTVQHAYYSLAGMPAPPSNSAGAILQPSPPLELSS
jgi:hypothetical protein